MTTFTLSFILETLATDEGLNLITSGIDDVAFGMVISSDKTFLQVAREHSAVYNYQIVDGDPIVLTRRAVNDDLVIDYPDLNETDCIRRSGAPAVQLSRVDPASLPRQVEIFHIDPDRDYAISSQVARHTAAPTTNSQISLSIDFIISTQQARDLAFDLLYRIWAQQMALSFEHPNMNIAPGDTFTLTTTRGTFTCLVGSNRLNMPARTNTIAATILLTSKGVTVSAPEADEPFLPHSSRFNMFGIATVQFVGAGGGGILTSSGAATVSFISSAGDDDTFLLLIE